jgi:hypothetical protein
LPCNLPLKHVRRQYRPYIFDEREPSANNIDAEKRGCHYIIRIRSQSGHIQVGPLLIPHLFSSKQSLQIMKPQGQLQQNSCFFPQQ